MTSALPFWLQVITAVATPIIAVVVAAIALLQWRTAHNKGVLDLFEKRWNVYVGMPHSGRYQISIEKLHLYFFPT